MCFAVTQRCFTTYSNAEIFHLNTYIAIPLKNIRDRCFVRKVKITIKYHVLSNTRRQIIRFCFLLQYQGVIEY